MKRFLQVPVHLELFVKVENNWRNKQKYLKEFGYNEDELLIKKKLFFRNCFKNASL